MWWTFQCLRIRLIAPLRHLQYIEGAINLLVVNCFYLWARGVPKQMYICWLNSSSSRKHWSEILWERVVKDKEMTNLKVTRSWMMTSGIQRNYYKETTSFEVLDEKKLNMKTFLLSGLMLISPLLQSAFLKISKYYCLAELKLFGDFLKISK